MTTQKGIHGEWIISDIIHGYLATKRYYGYTKKESIRRWKEEALDNELEIQ